MASNGCSLVRFIDISQDSFYFEVDNPDMENDGFKISANSSQHLIQSKDQKYLVLNTEGNLEVKNLSTDELFDTENKFNIQLYKNSDLEKRKGRAAILYANKNGQKIVVCCSESYTVYAEAMDPPQEVNGQKHKAVFYTTTQSASNQYRFESSMHKDWFLGFESERDNLQKLVLKEDSDRVDQSCKIHVLD